MKMVMWGKTKRDLQMLGSESERYFPDQIEIKVLYIFQSVFNISQQMFHPIKD